MGKINRMYTFSDHVKVQISIFLFQSSLQDESVRNRRSARPKLLKRYTFQDMSANAYAVNNIEYDITGEVMLSPTSKAAFAFLTEADLEDHNLRPTEFNVDLPSLT